MLQPKRTKFRKMQKGRIKGNAQRGTHIAFGSFGLKAVEEGFITSRQIEAARIAVTRYMKRQGNVWIRIFPDKPITSKPAEVRMGKGKGAPSHWVAVFVLEELCSKRMVSLLKQRKKHLDWLLKSCRLKRNS